MKIQLNCLLVTYVLTNVTAKDVMLLYYTLYVSNQLWFLQRSVNITVTHNKITQIIISAFYTAYAKSTASYSRLVLS
jgi:hypothetical protein